MDGVYGAAVLAAGAGLFAIDILEPRGVVDGVGYSALVALTSRFGEKAVLGSAAVTTLLTLLGAALLPDAGIGLGGMWANRIFAIAAIWVVALIIRTRLELERRAVQREDNLDRHEAALGAMIRACIQADIDFSERLRFICQSGAEALGGVFALVGLRNDDGQTVTVLQSWRKPPGPLLRPPGSVLYVDRYHKSKLAEDFVIAITDTELAPLESHTKRALRGHGVRATLSAEIFHGPMGTGTLIFGREEPHRWLEEEIAFARSAAHLIGVLLSMERNAETLAALELTDDGIYTVDAAGKVQYANRAARLLARQKDGRLHFPGLGEPLQGDQDSQRITYESRDLDIHRARLPGGGLIARLADMTEQNRVAAEKARLEERLQQSAKMEAIGQLASGVAHDFNNILGAIIGFAGFISQDSAADSEIRQFAQRILNAGRRGKEMVEQIMAFAETRAVSHGITNLGRALLRSEEMFASGMHPGAILEVELPEFPVLVRGNEVQLGQLINNLIANARDALEGRSGVVEVSAASADDAEIETLRHFESRPGTRLIGEIEPGLRYARIRVRDTGHGIAPDILGRIFDPFFTTKGRQRGTGLGLAVAHGVIRSHNGVCLIESQLGLGTVFTIYLPLLEDGAAQQHLPAPVAGEAWRVLIVDDEADMADMLSIALERLGHQTVSVQDPVAALAAIEEDPTAFDALLTDQLMPFMQGIDLIREAKRLAPALRTVLCTGNAESLSESEATAMGADAVLYKPVDIQAVVQAVRG